HPFTFVDVERQVLHRLDGLVAASQHRSQRGGQPRRSPVHLVALGQVPDVDHVVARAPAPVGAAGAFSRPPCILRLGRGFAFLVGGKQMATVALTAENFNQHVEKNGVLVIDWWAPWCGPCRAFGPIYEKASENAKYGDVTFGKINT